MDADAEVDAATSRDADAVLTASRALLAVVARSLAPVLDQVTLPQFRALVVLSSSTTPLRNGDLAAALGVHPSTFSRAADRLVAGGWVSRVENPGSRRETLIELTAEGRALVATVTRRRRAEIKRILSRLEPAQRDAVRRGLEAFAGAAGEPSVDDLAALGL
jgi:DNA-binding MarR family transcriptional regulator